MNPELRDLLRLVFNENARFVGVYGLVGILESVQCGYEFAIEILLEPHCHAIYASMFQVLGELRFVCVRRDAFKKFDKFGRLRF